MPESIRSCALKGADLIIVPTANTKVEPMEMFEWEMRVQAMQNQVFIAMCNRVGTEDKMQFAGESIVIDPRGKVLAKADDREQLLVCDIDLQEVKKSEAVWIIYHFEDLSSMINKGENKKWQNYISDTGRWEARNLPIF